MTRKEIIAHLRNMQAHVRGLTAQDEYLRGLYNGIEMTLAVLENTGFKPIVKPSLESEGKGDVVTEALDILSGRAKP